MLEKAMEVSFATAPLAGVIPVRHRTTTIPSVAEVPLITGGSRGRFELGGVVLGCRSGGGQNET